MFWILILTVIGIGVGIGLLYLSVVLYARETYGVCNICGEKKSEYFTKCLSEMIETEGRKKELKHSILDYSYEFERSYIRFYCPAGEFEGAIKLSDCVSITVSPYYKKKTESFYTPPKEKSVVGSAVVGGLLAGGVGAVVGAVSAADKNARQTGTTSYMTTSDKSFRYGKICIRFRNTMFNDKIMKWCIPTNRSYELVYSEIEKIKGEI